MRSEPSRLVEQLAEMGIPRGPILDAVSTVPRTHFVPTEQKRYAWENRPLPIGAEQTISQPYTVARMLELAAIRRSSRVLEVGCGSGYAAALIAQLTGEGGTVVAIEILPSLAARAEQALAGLGIGQVRVITGDGKKGFLPCAPYASIIVSAQAAEIPGALLEQLDEDGTLVMPLGIGGTSNMTRICRRGTVFETTQHGPYSFVPLV
jgi:protein-L-isoaspartate(D-aspartate) O-methyltransferase